jgi:hypothetical protein
MAAAQTPPAPAAHCDGLPPGKHANLERMTAGMNLTCEQQLRIEPLLHDEESVSKPLLRFSSFSAEERSEFMNKVKIAARRQIRNELKADQKQWMDDDIANVAKSGKKGGGKKAVDKKEPAPGADPLADEESLSKAVMAYAALSPEEKKSMVLQIKRAARNDSALGLTAEQQKSLDAQIAALSQSH